MPNGNNFCDLHFQGMGVKTESPKQTFAEVFEKGKLNDWPYHSEAAPLGVPLLLLCFNKAFNYMIEKYVSDEGVHGSDPRELLKALLMEILGACLKKIPDPQTLAQKETNVEIFNTKLLAIKFQAITFAEIKFIFDLVAKEMNGEEASLEEWRTPRKLEHVSEMLIICFEYLGGIDATEEYFQKLLDILKTAPPYQKAA